MLVVACVVGVAMLQSAEAEREAEGEAATEAGAKASGPPRKESRESICLRERGLRIERNMEGIVIAREEGRKER